jgi:hypothetical protein
MDPALAATSAAQLFDLQRTHSAEILYGHDPAQWSRLPKAPLALAGA